MFRFTDLQLMIFEKERIECRDVAALLGDYCDGELPESLRHRLDAHIAECDRCQELLKSYQLTIQLARELRDKPIPSGVRMRLRQNLNKRLGLNLSVDEKGTEV